MKVASVAFNTPVFSTVSGKEVCLREELRVFIVASGAHYLEEAEAEYFWKMPKGFMSDLRSGPAIAGLALPKWGDDPQQTALIFLHDYCYSRGCSYEISSKHGRIHSSNITKKHADDFFVEGLRWTKWPGYKCWAIALALKAAGGSRFGKDPVRIWNAQKQEEETC
jgi:hypothetical protein